MSKANTKQEAHADIFRQWCAEKIDSTYESLLQRNLIWTQKSRRMPCRKTSSWSFRELGV